MRVLFLVSVGLSGYACKSENSRLASNAQRCNKTTLEALRSEHSKTAGKDPASLHLASDSNSESLISKYTYGHRLQSNDFVAAISKAPADGWQSHLASGCLQYGAKTAEDKCSGSFDCGYFSVDKNSANYVKYRSDAVTECQNDFNTFVQSKGTTPRVEPATDDADRAKKIAELREKIAKCEADIKRLEGEIPEDKAKAGSELDFEARCTRAGGTVESLEPPFQCGCFSGKIINLDAKEECPKEGSDSSITPPSPPTPPQGSKCECKMQNGRCSKVVNGSVVDSLTPIMNTTTGKQETCDAGGGGGFDNLCNQPQLKCP